MTDEGGIPLGGFTVPEGEEGSPEDGFLPLEGRGVPLGGRGVPLGGDVTGLLTVRVTALDTPAA